MSFVALPAVCRFAVEQSLGVSIPAGGVRVDVTYRTRHFRDLRITAEATVLTSADVLADGSVITSDTVDLTSTTLRDTFGFDIVLTIVAPELASGTVTLFLARKANGNWGREKLGSITVDSAGTHALSVGVGQ